MRDPLSHPLSRLFLDVGLLLEVDRAERLVFKDRWGANHVVWEDVELLFAWGSKSKSPHL
jgi:hypothetical protein